MTRSIFMNKYTSASFYLRKHFVPTVEKSHCWSGWHMYVQNRFHRHRLLLRILGESTKGYNRGAGKRKKASSGQYREEQQDYREARSGRGWVGSAPQTKRTQLKHYHLQAERTGVRCREQQDLKLLHVIKKCKKKNVKGWQHQPPYMRTQHVWT